MIDGNEYLHFENRFRGSEEEISKRLEKYLDLLNDFFSQKSISALDLGSGRGEWLKLLQGNGISSIGVENNFGMITKCRESGLTIIDSDVRDVFANLEKNSLDLITGFHIIEHLEPHQIESLINQTFEALRAGGILIFEMPNLNNMLVGGNNFWIDPTHKRPVPAVLVEYYLSNSGFKKILKWGFQEESRLKTSIDISLMDALFGASPDIALVAQKNHDGHNWDLDTLRVLEVGLTTENLVSKFDSQLRYDLEEIKHTIENIDLRKKISKKIFVYKFVSKIKHISRLNFRFRLKQYLK